MSLQVGGWGIDTTVLSPRSMQWLGADTLMLTGHLKGASLAETVAMRDTLLGVLGHTVPVMITEDSDADGYYLISYVATQPGAAQASLSGVGLWTYRLDARVRGPANRVRWESKLVGTVLTNDHGVTEAESAPFVGLPTDAYGIDFGSSAPSTVTRGSEDGDVVVYLDVPYTTKPSWGVALDDWEKGMCRLVVSSYRRPGLVVPDAPTSWTLSNGIIRVVGSASDGRFTVDYHKSGWQSGHDFIIDVGGTNVGTWEALTVLRNTPEAVAIRLENDQTGGRITADLEIRRGSRFVSVYVTRHASATLKIERTSTDAATAVTPTGASTAVAIKDSAGTDRWVLGSAQSHTQDTTNGAISKASATLDAFIGYEIDAAGPSTGDAAGDLCLQYLGYVWEDVQAVLR